MSLAAAWSSLDKVTVRRIKYFIVFTLYVTLRNLLLPSVFAEYGGFLPWTMVAADMITFGVIIGYVVTTVRHKSFSPVAWGLDLRTKEWLFIGIICAIGVYFAINHNGISWKYAVGGLLLVFQFTTYELIFRAAIMNLLLKVLGNNLKSVLFAVFISALMYSVALLPLKWFSVHTVGILLVLSYLFYYARSIILFVFLMASYAAPNDYGIWVALFSILIYLCLTIMAPHLGERAGITDCEMGR